MRWSSDPADLRSTGPALFVGGWALTQLWAFWLAPLVGAAIAALAYPLIAGVNGAEPVAEEGQDTDRATIAAGDVPAARAPAEAATDDARASPHPADVGQSGR